MPTIYDISQEYKRRLIEGNDAAINELLLYYVEAKTSLMRSLERLVTVLREDARNRDKIDRVRLERLSRYKSLISQIAVIAETLRNRTKQSVVEQSKNAVALAGDALSEQLATIDISFNRLPEAAITQLVADLSEGSPLERSISNLGAGLEEAKKLLVTGLVAGLNPRVLGEFMGSGLSVDVGKSIRIARTTTLNAYREASRASYNANDDIITGWQWNCSKSVRTCPSCLAMDGKIFPLSEPLGTHPNCRCAMLPVIGGVDYGLQTGKEWLEGLTSKQKQQILGKGAYQLYKDKQVSLGDFVHQSEHEDWGRVRRTKTLRELQEDG